MKYLFLALSSLAVTYYLIGLMIQGQLADIAEGLRHRPDAPTSGEYLRKAQPHARRVQRQYTLLVGSGLALVVCLIAYWVN
ncbi:MAG TPA: hypothetical protein VES70_28115 [Pseudomonas sp.]|nr:hypothetical protein [Pseudomonas sp.]